MRKVIVYNIKPFLVIPNDGRCRVVVESTEFGDTLCGIHCAFCDEHHSVTIAKLRSEAVGDEEGSDTKFEPVKYSTPRKSFWES